MSKENKLELKPISVHEASKGALKSEIERLKIEAVKDWHRLHTAISDKCYYKAKLSTACDEIESLTEQQSSWTGCKWRN